MAKSMIARRQEAERLRIAAYEASLKRVSAGARPAPDFEQALADAKAGFAHETIRASHDWRPKLKTRCSAKLRLAAARHLYGRYPVPAHLEAIWLQPGQLDAAEVALRKRWYIVAAKGGSLYKAEAGQWLSRKEVHWFLNAPGALDFSSAFWVAIARTYTDDPGTALRIGRSKIAQSARSDLPFWREVARFFAANPAPLETMDDLCDYFADAYRRDRAYSLKGRTLGSLARQMAEWHRDLAVIERIEAARRRAEQAQARAEGRDWQTPKDAGTWAGSYLADWSWKPSAKEASDKRETFEVVQLIAAAALVAESSAMHHCVSSYASKCIAGYASIWSLRRKTPGKSERMLTIELDRQHRAVQVRGFANRLARPDEVKVLERWAKARGVVLPAQ